MAKILTIMGRLHLIMGCMFAQKTTELLRRVRRYQSIGHRVLIVNFIEDTRYGVNCIASHDKVLEAAHCVRRLEEIESLVSSYDVVAIDEGQFFPDLFACVTRWADTLAVDVVVAGLSGDAERRPFGDMLRLVPHAEEVVHLHALCVLCRDGTAASYSKRTVIESAESIQIGTAKSIQIGATESYQPVCRSHYLAYVSL